MGGLGFKSLPQRKRGLWGVRGFSQWGFLQGWLWWLMGGPVHPVNDDPILYVDEDDGYVPNLPLIREECYEILTIDVDDHLVFPPAKEVSTSEDVQQSKKANGYSFVHVIYLHVFWTDEISNKNYEVLGDVLAFDATYYTNKQFFDTESRHVYSDLHNNTDFRAYMHRLVWNLFISPATFETRWVDLITRCESSNASFKVNSSGANTLVQFILCYATSIESQCYRQCLAEYKTPSRPYQSLSAPFKNISRTAMDKINGEPTKSFAYREGGISPHRSLLRNEILGLISNCVDSLRNDYDGLAVFANKGIRNKGCGKSRRLIGAGEKAVDKSLRTPRLCRRCQKYVMGHDPRNCKKKRTEAVDTIDGNIS
ncbi:hypothetical protein E3N88_31544 [Mikania micrantha]|uniref:Uncharacterized protein n=1 Tax=Mikania micrantha TaxID=192012 RepID=A0A5N6MPX0_9ASTR|nr:hypothetical protein E3N88_31544 [Mikania micrantha]